MALKAGSVPQLPDLACMGIIKKVGNAYLSEKGVYHVLPLEIEGKFAARDGVFFFVFEPRWFGDSFDPSILREEDPRSPKYGMYRRAINDEAKPSHLVAMAGEQFEELGAEFEGNDEPNEKDVENALRKYLTGRDVIYLMKQRTDEDKKPTDQYNIQGFYPATDETIEYFQEQAQNERRKTPLVVTWDE